MNRILCAVLLIWLSETAGAQKSIDLSGRWNLRLDRNYADVEERWFAKTLNDDTIHLPGSMPEKLKGDPVSADTKWTASLYDSSYYFNPYMAKYRVEENFKVPFFLTSDRHYVGVAWYQKEIEIPRSWRGERIVFSMERPHIETTVWINDQEADMQNSLCVLHVYDITQLASSGKCRITVRVDNRIKDIDVGPDSHSITDHTQGNWSSIAGKIELTAIPKTYFEDIQVYPDVTYKKAVARMAVRSLAYKNAPVTITLSAEAFNSPHSHSVAPVLQTIHLSGGEIHTEMELEMGEGMLTWDEFDPALYKLTARLEQGGKSEVKEIRFGMREFTIQGK